MAWVLVVDDDAAIRQLLTYAFTMEGYKVETLCDGRAVVATLRESSERVIVLMDVMMPHMDGWEVCRQLLEEPETLARHAIVLMSAGLAPGEIAPQAARATLAKPFNLERALALVARLSLEPSEAGARAAERDPALRAQ